MILKLNGSKAPLVRTAVGLGIIGAGIAKKKWWGAMGIIPLAMGLNGLRKAHRRNKAEMDSEAR